MPTAAKGPNLPAAESEAPMRGASRLSRTRGLGFKLALFILTSTKIGRAHV